MKTATRKNGATHSVKNRVKAKKKELPHPKLVDGDLQNMEVIAGFMASDDFFRAVGFRGEGRDLYYAEADECEAVDVDEALMKLEEISELTYRAKLDSLPYSENARCRFYTLLIDTIVGLEDRIPVNA